MLDILKECHQKAVNMSTEEKSTISQAVFDCMVQSFNKDRIDE